MKKLIAIGSCLAVLACFCSPSFAADSAPAPSSAPPAEKTATAKPAAAATSSLNAKHSVIEEDPRLQRTVTLVLQDRPVSELLAKLTELTAVKMDATSTVADKKLTVIGRGAPVVRIMAEIGYLFDWGWLRNTQKDEIAYRLQPKPGAQYRAQQLRDSIVNTAIDQAAAAEWQKTQPVLDVWIASGGDIDAIRDADPDMADTIRSDPNLEYKLGILATMAPAIKYSWIAQQIRATNEVQGPSLSYSLVKTYLSTNPVASESADPAFSKKISLKLAAGASLSDALQAFAKVAHYSVIADSYDRKTTLTTVEWKDTSISDVLDSIAGDAGYDWSASGRFMRFRNKTWFLDELRSVPESVAKKFKDLKDKQGRLMFQDYVDLVSSLTDDQLSGLADSGTRYGLAEDGAVALRYLPYFRFFAGLNSSQLAAVWDPGGLSMGGMSRTQQDAFLRLMALSGPLTPPYWAPGVTFFARQRGSLGYEIVLTFDVQNRSRWDTRLNLPAGKFAPPATPAPAPTPPAATPPAAPAASAGAEATPPAPSSLPN